MHSYIKILIIVADEALIDSVHTSSYLTVSRNLRAAYLPGHKKLYDTIQLKKTTVVKKIMTSTTEFLQNDDIIFTVTFQVSNVVKNRLHNYCVDATIRLMLSIM